MIFSRLFGRGKTGVADQTLPKIIWMLWHQGWDKAPEVAHAARQSWVRRNPGWEVRALDQNSLAGFLPERTMDFIYGMPKEQESMANLVRMELLCRYGGVWADATTLCMRPLDDWMVPAMPKGFFAFDRPANDRMIATWFLAALPQNALVGTLRTAMNGYWQGREKRYTYFWTHGLFSQCYQNDPAFRAIWDGTPRLPAKHRFHFGPDHPALLAPAADCGVDLADIFANPPSPVFKLTHKFTTQPQPGSLFSQLCYLSSQI